MLPGRWSRSLQVSVVLCALILLTIVFAPQQYRPAVPNREQFSQYFHGHPPEANTSSPQTTESPLLQPSDLSLELESGALLSTPNGLIKGNPSFHLLVTNAKRSAALCRTLLSATILDYPPPTLIDYIDNAENDLQPGTGIAGVHEFLKSTQSGLGEDDVVLVVDGRSTFFQLPSNVLLHRLGHIETVSNHWSRSRYGAQNTGETETPRPRFSQSVFLGSTTDCNAYPDYPACHATVEHGFPSTVDASAVIGQAPNMKKAYQAAFGKANLRSDDYTRHDHTSVLGRLFADQESSREGHSKHSASHTGWGDFSKHRPWASSKTTITEEASERLHADKELGMALDYTSMMFLTAVQSRGDVDFLRFDKDGPGNETVRPAAHVLPVDLKTSTPPVRPAVDKSASEIDFLTSFPFNETLDILPSDKAWSDLSLATLAEKNTVPVLLHLDARGVGGNTTGSRLWNQMWYQPYARALLRNALRAAEGPGAMRSAAMGGDLDLDQRGGKGGFWTTEGEWLEFGEVCSGFEAELFRDGMGPWGLEGGPQPRCNIKGELISGEGDCEEIMRLEQEAEENARKEEEEREKESEAEREHEAEREKEAEREEES